jgi:hypothetical protein
MAHDPKAPKGFAGLNDLASDIDAPSQSSNRSSIPTQSSPTANPSSQPRANPSPSSLNNTSKARDHSATAIHVQPRSGFDIQPGDVVYAPKARGIPSWMYVVGIFVIIGVVVLLNQAADKRLKSVSSLSQTDSYSPPKPTAPPKPTPAVTKTYYKIRGSDGNTFEIEGPANASAEQINSIARARWTPLETYYPEERPNVGDGILLNDNQIRYCLSQKIRMAGWSSTVDSYNQGSVAAFNEMVRDYNLRCSHFQYHAGDLERVQSQVNERWDKLNADGRAHRGPRPPPQPPNYKKISSRQETTGGEAPPIASSKNSPRCAGSYEPEKCEALEAKLRSESPEQANARRQALDKWAHPIDY